MFRLKAGSTPWTLSQVSERNSENRYRGLSTPSAGNLSETTGTVLSAFLWIAPAGNGVDRFLRAAFRPRVSRSSWQPCPRI